MRQRRRIEGHSFTSKNVETDDVLEGQRFWPTGSLQPLLEL